MLQHSGAELRALSGATGPLIAGRQSDGGMLGAGRPWERPCGGGGAVEEQNSEGTEEEVHTEGADRGEGEKKKQELWEGRGGKLEDMSSMLTDANRCGQMRTDDAC